MTALSRVDARVTWLLSQASGHAHTTLNHALAAHGARGYHYRLLAALDQYGASSQADLARHSRLDRSDVTLTLNELVTAGHARRASDPSDRRRNVASITPRGRRLLARLDVVVDEVQSVVLERLTPRERRQLADLLVRIGPPT